jgi:hypothetical protein
MVRVPRPRQREIGRAWARLRMLMVWEFRTCSASRETHDHRHADCLLSRSNYRSESTNSITEGERYCSSNAGIMASLAYASQHPISHLACWLSILQYLNEARGRRGCALLEFDWLSAQKAGEGASLGYEPHRPRILSLDDFVGGCCR